MSRLLIASNRLPVTVRAEHGAVSVVPSAGGLATALRGPHERHGGLWIGWPGDVSRLSAEQRRHVDQQLADLRTVPVTLSAGEVSRYYDGLSNGVLWPLFHYVLDKVRIDARRDFEAYEVVNERFAMAVAEHYKPGDLIWIHDYQLMLVPELLRRRLPDARIGFFLHIPFPAVEIFRTLPFRERILRGLLGADVIGFHTVSYRQYFADATAHLLGAPSEGDEIVHEGRRVRLGAYPISVDVEELTKVAARHEVQAEARRIRARAPSQKIALGLDRLDYTKGILRRLLSIERFLERASDLRRKVRFIQLAIPTRENVDAYAENRKLVNEAVGRINGQYGTVDAVPIHLLHRSMPIEQVVALYLAADVMMVTPLRDGMNLVAKEYVTTRLDDTGALVLSEFSGAAAELREALTVNPYDIDGMAAAIKRALLMPVEEQQIRMRELRRRVISHDVHRWAQSFLDDMERAPGVSVAPPSSRSGAPPIEEASRIREADALLLILDYDGTLCPIASRPELAVPDEALIGLLRDLAARPGTWVHVVSGRKREDLDRWLGGLPIGLHAEHGFCSRAPGEAWTTVEMPPPIWKEGVRAILDDLSQRTPGSFFEDKPMSIAWHYRNTEPELARARAHELAPRLADWLREHDLEVIQGASVLEVRPRGLHKGLVVPTVLASAPASAAMVAIGDDRTDEDLFAAVPAETLTIHVGNGPSRAAHHLPDVGAVRRFLRSLFP
jgi:trehalose 6-phosphate synthase/phosphatase